ncbi:MBL fold metallo-hydrolase [Thomasclavelia sp.]|uniref:MBL fold metallo-hydrolase n=1 Tax=Thomasclavelia sp. TaxID=3025757 RepID=UPI0025DDF327|nr:MBL fold metallo-hydrolase [Thomasclavelia sp.]
MREKGKKILRGIRNFLGYLVILSGLAITTVYILPGILIMIVGLIITSHFNTILDKRNLTMKKRYKIILCLILFFVAVGLSPTSSRTDIEKNYDDKQTVTKKTEEKVEPEAKASNIKIHFIDTGNSDCTFIQSRDKNMLIDGGNNNDEQRIVNYLNDLGIRKIDYLVSTHPDADHCGGLDAAVTNFEIGQSYVSNGSSDSKTYRDFIYSLSSKGLTPAVPLEDTAIELDGDTNVKFYNTQATGEGNELSLVALLTSGDHQMLFMGDATEKVEKSILDKIPNSIDILKVSHHGSKTGTSEELLDSISLKYAVIECGKNNKYEHPNKEVLDRLDDSDAKVFRTDKKGNIIFTTDKDKISYEFTDTTSKEGSAPVTRDPSDEIKKQQEEAERQAQIAAEQEAKRQAEEAQRQAELEAQRQAQEAQRQAQAQQQQQQNQTRVYIASSGNGKKYHSNPNCSNMKNPTAVSITEAQNRGFDACKKCY